MILDERLNVVHLSIARLARESGVNYRTLQEGRGLTQSEIDAVEAVIAAAELTTKNKTATLEPVAASEVSALVQQPLSNQP